MHRHDGSVTCHVTSHHRRRPRGDSVVGSGGACRVGSRVGQGARPPTLVKTRNLKNHHGNTNIWGQMAPRIAILDSPLSSAIFERCVTAVCPQSLEDSRGGGVRHSGDHVMRHVLRKPRSGSGCTSATSRLYAPRGSSARGRGSSTRGRGSSQQDAEHVNTSTVPNSSVAPEKHVTETRDKHVGKRKI